jgi:hypothetical protein
VCTIVRTGVISQRKLATDCVSNVTALLRSVDNKLYQALSQNTSQLSHTLLEIQSAAPISHAVGIQPFTPRSVQVCCRLSSTLCPGHVQAPTTGAPITTGPKLSFEAWLKMAGEFDWGLRRRRRNVGVAPGAALGGGAAVAVLAVDIGDGPTKMGKISSQMIN